MHVITSQAVAVLWKKPRWCTYLLTARCRLLLEQLTGLQLVKKFPAFHGTQKFITALTRVRHLSLSWASPIQSIYPHPTSWRSILILSTQLRLGLPSVLLTSGFPRKILYTPSPHPYEPHAQPKSLTGWYGSLLKLPRIYYVLYTFDMPYCHFFLNKTFFFSLAEIWTPDNKIECCLI
jgi:hypothetical protein